MSLLLMSTVQDWTEINFIINQFHFLLWYNLSARPSCQTELDAEVKWKKTDRVFSFPLTLILSVLRQTPQRLVHSVFTFLGDFSFRRFSSTDDSGTAGIRYLMPSTAMQALGLKLAPVFCHILQYFWRLDIEIV